MARRLGRSNDERHQAHVLPDATYPAPVAPAANLGTVSPLSARLPLSRDQSTPLIAPPTMTTKPSFAPIRIDKGLFGIDNPYEPCGTWNRREGCGLANEGREPLDDVAGASSSDPPRRFGHAGTFEDPLGAERHASRKAEIDVLGLRHYPGEECGPPTADGHVVDRDPYSIASKRPTS